MSNLKLVSIDRLKYYNNQLITNVITPNLENTLQEVSEKFGHSLSVSGNTLSLLDYEGTTLNSVTLPQDVGNHASNKVTAMTGYEKANSSSAISPSDTLNQALGKLEYKVDNTGGSSGGSSVDLTNVDSNIVPSTNITYDLGSNQKMFRTLYINSLKGSHDNWWYSSGIMLDSALIPSENVDGWGKVKNCDLGDDTHYFNRVFVHYNFIDYITSQQKNSQGIEYVTCVATLLPDKDDYNNVDYDLGATNRKWRNIYGTYIYQGNNRVIDSSSVGVGSSAIQTMLNTVFAS